ncbi:HYC_CC_PP family protein [Hymenobacter psychrophilus]|uniref:Uncharacterized protein n=1 Tax=Hymenobacter psychrophilus TaxID=651662 RepID=A0A1H3IUI0_9BACT|nr:hypothetical protein [Hymenobacter psychrophilus]SDY31207.1 hypothetical protein SAMN04488069_107155 [Hymenobacter psychrophilus]
MKRPLLHRLFSVWLALLVLTSSVGLAVQQHLCLQSGQRSTDVIFRPARHGCPPVQTADSPHQAEVVPLVKSCCEFGAHFHKLDAASAQLNWAKTSVPALLPAWPTAPFPAFKAAALHRAAAHWYAADSSPPPLGGRALLVRVGILVV